jgi:RND superfamily putative drug exporter
VLGAIADLTWKRPKTVLAVIGIAAAAAGFFAHDVEHHLKAAGFTDSASESEQSTALLDGALGYDPNPGLTIVVRPPEGAGEDGKLDLTKPAVRTEINRIAAAVGEAVYVAKVDNPAAEPPGTPLVAADGRSAVVLGHLESGDLEDAGGYSAEDAEKRIGESTLDVQIGGFAPSFNDVNDQTREDLTKAEMIAFPLLALLLLLVFRGVIAASIPLLIGVLSIIGSFLVLRVMSEFVDTSLFALNIATGLSLGLAVDYALLMISRYREELERHGPTREAHRTTVMTAGRAAVFSGVTVAIALAALVVMPQRFLYSIGVAGAAVGILTAVMTLFVVPSILSLTGEKINALAIRRGPAVSDESGGWYRLAHGVMRRPILVALTSSLLLLATASPLLYTTLTGPSAEAVAPGLPSYDPNQYVEDHYPRAFTEAVSVTIEGPASPPRLEKLSTRIGSIEGMAGPAPFEQATPELHYANFSLDGKALSARAQDAVRDIRALPLPPGEEVLVSGNTARFLDLKQSLLDHTPIVAGIVALSMFLILFLLTGSVLLPIKTLIMNALTLAATLGILALVFGEGFLSGLVDYTGPEAIEVVSLVFLFAVLFGLATDYAVLVMARIKEAYDTGMSNEEAVAHGIARTGRVITAAAVMIAVVFLAFAVSPIFFMKQIAVGMAVGVLLDATIVRALLVPALMRLFGSWNWWAPKPLRWLHWRFGFNES